MSEKKEKKGLPPARFWNCEQTAAYLGVSIHTLYKKMSQGVCPIPIKRPMGARPMFDAEDVRRYADSLTSG